MSQSRNEFGGRNFAPKYLATRTGEVVDHVPGTGKAVQVLFEGARSPQDMVLSTPLHICVNESCCQPTVVRHSAINRIGNGMSEVSVNLRCINCDTRYSRVCSPGDVHALDDRMFEAQRVLEQTIAEESRRNMAEDVGNLILGLRLNLIGPDDFTTQRTSWEDMQPPVN